MPKPRIDYCDRGFILPLKTGKSLVPFDDILYVAAELGCSVIYFGQRKCCVYESLHVLKDALPSYFIYCNRSIIVNAHKFEVKKLSDRYVLVCQEICFSISRRRRGDFLTFSRNNGR